jgi:hypothetical protein
MRIPTRSRARARAALVVAATAALVTLAVPGAASAHPSDPWNHLSFTVAGPRVVAASGPSTSITQHVTTSLAASNEGPLTSLRVSLGAFEGGFVAHSANSTNSSCTLPQGPGTAPTGHRYASCTFRHLAAGSSRRTTLTWHAFSRNLPAQVSMGLLGPYAVSSPGFTGSMDAPAFPEPAITLRAGPRVVMGAGVNTITATGIANVIYVGDGADVVDGRGGDDDLYGQAGDDRLTCGAGRDEAHGGTGADQLRCDDDSPGDVIDGGAGTDVCAGNVGDVFTGCETVHRS